MLTKQEQRWTREFGQEFTNRNPARIDELDPIYRARYGVSRSEINAAFTEGMDRTAPVLEVGSNVGIQLEGLHRIGFERLAGIDLQFDALRRAQSLVPGAVQAQASALALPFAPGVFELVFTTALLIHIPPAHIGDALDELYRCSRRYIWCWEYFATQYTEVCWHGEQSMLWKADFARLFLQRHTDLRLVEERQLESAGTGNLDTVFLLEKAQS